VRSSIAPLADRHEAGVTRDSDVRLQILGPLRAWRKDVELDAGPRQQAYLLALLLARSGRPISMDELIELIWDQDPPTSAVNIIHKYVGALRRLLEPSVRTRDTGSYVQRRGNGYLFEGSAAELDIVAFRTAVRAAKDEVSKGRDEPALDRYDEALGLWRGHAGQGLSCGLAGQALFAALDDEFFDACTAAAELAVPLGQAGRVLQPLQLAASMAPLHEPVHASLIAGLSAVGKHAQALMAFNALRKQLADELGVYPGAAVQRAYQHVLAQTSSMAEAEGPDQQHSPVIALADRVSLQPARVVEAKASLPLIGRGSEVTRACQALEAASAGNTGLVIIEGDPGVGKTRLLEEVAAIAAGKGVRTAWGQCLEGGGTPAMWPWVEVLGALVDALPSTARDKWVAGELGRILRPREDVPAATMTSGGSSQFQLFEQAAALVRQVSALQPVALVFDDLQWADVASLELLGYLAARLPAGAAVLGALRARAPEPGPDLARLLAAVSRITAHRRVSLGPLAEAEVAELVRRETGLVPGPGAARGIHARTAGNPFFVRELSRLLAEGGALTDETVADAGVPSTVRDIVRDRMSGVDSSAADLLQIAASIGRSVDLGLLARTAAIDVDACLDRLGPVAALGLLEPTAGDPFSLRFAHDLVREAVVEATPALRTAGIHLRVADALEDTGRDDESTAERLAYHLWAAGPLADPARAAGALLLASRRATAKFALAAAERQCRLAADVARTAGLPDLELAALSQLTAVVAMQTGFVAAAPDLLERAEHLAHRLGREREATDFLFARWTAHAHSTELDRGGFVARRLLQQGETSDDPVVRAYGLHAWGVHQWALGNIGTAIQYLSQLDRTALRPSASRSDGLRHGQQLLSPVKLAEVMALHGDLNAARSLLDTVEGEAAGHPYAITTWSTWASKIAAMAGDPAWALRAAQRGVDVDPEFTFAFLGTYIRLNLCWARAMSGADRAGPVAEARDLVASLPLDPPRAGITTCYELLGEMFLAAGMLADAAAALDQAEMLRESRGERQTEGLSLLLRGRLLEAQGEHAAAVKVAERARCLSAARGAHLFAGRAEKLLQELTGS
jgi:DNA-binding SARP family transcriptional activator